jgi:hypothetical protein
LCLIAEIILRVNVASGNNEPPGPQKISHRTMTRHANSQLLAALNWRYAVKQFDASEKIAPDTWTAIEDSLACPAVWSVSAQARTSMRRLKKSGRQRLIW